MLRVDYFVLKNAVLRSYQELTRTVKCNPPNEEENAVGYSTLLLDENEFYEIKIRTTCCKSHFIFWLMTFVFIKIFNDNYGTENVEKLYLEG